MAIHVCGWPRWKSTARMPKGEASGMSGRREAMENHFLTSGLVPVQDEFATKQSMNPN